jgi:hypothetical protein
MEVNCKRQGSQMVSSSGTEQSEEDYEPAKRLRERQKAKPITTVSYDLLVAKPDPDLLIVFSSPSALASTSLKIFLISRIFELLGGNPPIPLSALFSLAFLASVAQPSLQYVWSSASAGMVDEQMEHLARVTPRVPKRSARSSAASVSCLVATAAEAEGGTGRRASGSEVKDLETRTGWSQAIEE